MVQVNGQLLQLVHRVIGQISFFNIVVYFSILFIVLHCCLFISFQFILFFSLNRKRRKTTPHNLSKEKKQKQRHFNHRTRKMREWTTLHSWMKICYCCEILVIWRFIKIFSPCWSSSSSVVYNTIQLSIEWSEESFQSEVNQSKQRMTHRSLRKMTFDEQLFSGREREKSIYFNQINPKRK